MGSIDTQQTLSSYSVQHEAKRLLEDGIFKNPKIAQWLPAGAADFASIVSFEGARLPSIPLPWRFAESAACLKATEACLIALLVQRKYGVKINSATINTDHASLFSMSPAVLSMAGTPPVDSPEHKCEGFFGGANITPLVPNYQFFNRVRTPYRLCATNIYRTKDGKWFHLHGSLNPDPTIESVGLPLEPAKEEQKTDWNAARQAFSDRMANITSAEMQHRASDVYRQAGTICYSVDQFQKSEHGRANAHVGLLEIYDVDSGHAPSWWPDTPQTSVRRPLAGLKVVDLTRIIAAPSVTRGLAELGASVMRVTSPNLPDASTLHIDLNWGKWNSSLDLKDESQREHLKNLIRDADVVVQGYRPGVLDKYGLSQDAIIDLVRDRRDRGIISVRENCYGWHGPWVSRSGWQQISDACVGISHTVGQYMSLENDEPVTPVFPNSDFMTGVVGVLGVLTTLLRRAERGGSYKLDLALNYYNSWLAESIGTYPRDTVWRDVWARHGQRVFRASDPMGITIPAYLDMLRQNCNDIIFNPEFFEIRRTKAVTRPAGDDGKDANDEKVNDGHHVGGGVDFRVLKPIIRFPNGEVQLEYNVGTRGNGRDAPRWPDDLMTEVVV